MRGHIQKWGNSLALRIPKSFAEEVGVSAGSPVELTLLEGQLRIQPVSRPSYSLEDLLAGVTDDNLHQAIESGPPVGDEVW